MRRDTRPLEALKKGAGVVVRVKPDYQHPAKLIVPMPGMIAFGERDGVLGLRLVGKGPLADGCRFTHKLQRYFGRSRRIF